MASETITLDANHDVTLVVGNPTDSNGQKRIKVNTSVLRLASPVWGAMFNGKFAERDMDEIPFPHDDSGAFLVVLQIAHFKSQEIPNSVTERQLSSLAILCDKYDVARIVSPYVLARGWLSPFKDQDGKWRRNIDSAKCARIVSTFQLKKESDYMIQLLAMTVSLDSRAKGSGKVYYRRNSALAILNDQVPDVVLTQVCDLRDEVVREIHSDCQKTLKTAMTQTTCKAVRKICQAKKSDLLMLNYSAVGMDTPPGPGYINPRSVSGILDPLRSSMNTNDIFPKDTRSPQSNMCYAKCLELDMAGRVSAIIDKHTEQGFSTHIGTVCGFPS